MRSDEVYELRRATNRVAVLESMLVNARKGDELSASMSGMFGSAKEGRRRP